MKLLCRLLGHGYKVRCINYDEVTDDFLDEVTCKRCDYLKLYTNHGVYDDKSVK